jgi:predicted HicB family RNase H-like nuclease
MNTKKGKSSRLTIDLPVEVHRLLKIEAAGKRMTMRQLVMKALYYYLKYTDDSKQKDA